MQFTGIHWPAKVGDVGATYSGFDKFRGCDGFEPNLGDRSLSIITLII